MLRKFIDTGVMAGGYALIACAILVTADVFLRKLFGVVIPDADLLSTYGFAIATSWAFSQVVLDRANVRLDLLTAALPRPAAAALDLLALLTLATFAAFMFERGWAVLQESWIHGSRSNTPMQIPQVVPQGLWVFGLLVLNITILVVLVRSLRRLRHRDWQGIADEIGIASASEESANEVKSLSTPAVDAEGDRAR